MNINVRTSIWESNSSSSHTISIPEELDDKFLDYTLVPDQNGVLVFSQGGFGWEIANYKDAYTKAQYMGIYCLTWYPEATFEGTLLIDILKEVLTQQTKCTTIEFNFGEKEYDSYIDHQSVEDKNYHWLFEDKEMLRQFIFNKKSILHTDNDNH